MNVNSEIRLVVLNKLGAVAKKPENLMNNYDFYELKRKANKNQRRILMEVKSNLLSSNHVLVQIFFTCLTGCGQTFVLKLLIEICHHYTDNDSHCNAYITCASTGNAAVAINGTTYNSYGI